MLYQELSSRVIGAFIAVHKELGPGLLEAPYHNALYYELRGQGLSVTYNAPFPVYYKGKQVGDYFADLVVTGKIITGNCKINHFISLEKYNYLYYN